MAGKTPTVSTLTLVVSAIARGELDGDIDNLFDALKRRRKAVGRQLADINSATLKPGARVMLKGLSPKSLNGHTGVIAVNSPYASRNSFTVDLDSPHYGRSRRANGETTVHGIPAQCVQSIEK